MAKDSGFLKTPMDYESGPTNPRPPGHYDSEPGYPARSGYGAGVTEKICEDWPTGSAPAEGSQAPGNPIVGPNIKA